MKLNPIINLIGSNAKASIKSINKIKLDSRELNRNDLFIAINSGYNYIDEALKKGCQVISEVERDDIIKVDDSIIALTKIAQYIRNKHKTEVIAVTGSNGKTTTKDLIYEVLSKKYKVLKNEKNKNNRIGLSETLLQLNDDYDIAVLELGMNHEGEIRELAKICKPDLSIITNIGSAHIGNLGSTNNILNAKLELKEFSKELIVNGEDKYLKKIDCLKVNLKLLKNIKYYCDRTEFDFKNEHFIFNMPGKHLIHDVLFAIKVGLIYDVNLNDIKDALNDYQTTNGRMNVIKDKFIIIDDCYNANFESVKGSLEILKKEKKLKYIILADMLELGEFSVRYHKKINKILKTIKNKKVLLLGLYTKFIDGIHFESLEDLIEYISTIDLEDSLILVKGSNRFQLNLLIDKIKTH